MRKIDRLRHELSEMESVISNRNKLETAKVIRTKALKFKESRDSIKETYANYKRKIRRHFELMSFPEEVILEVLEDPLPPPPPPPLSSRKGDAPLFSSNNGLARILFIFANILIMIVSIINSSVPIDFGKGAEKSQYRSIFLYGPSYNGTVSGSHYMSNPIETDPFSKYQSFYDQEKGLVVSLTTKSVTSDCNFVVEEEVLRENTWRAEPVRPGLPGIRVYPSEGKSIYEMLLDGSPLGGKRTVRECAELAEADPSWSKIDQAKRIFFKETNGQIPCSCHGLVIAKTFVNYNEVLIIKITSSLLPLLIWYLTKRVDIGVGRWYFISILSTVTYLIRPDGYTFPMDPSIVYLYLGLVLKGMYLSIIQNCIIVYLKDIYISLREEGCKYSVLNWREVTMLVTSLIISLVYIISTIEKFVDHRFPGVDFL
jgi:hypothetical protein